VGYGQEFKEGTTHRFPIALPRPVESRSLVLRVRKTRPNKGWNVAFEVDGHAMGFGLVNLHPRTFKVRIGDGGPMYFDLRLR
jgi:hypothetical protein